MLFVFVLPAGKSWQNKTYTRKGGNERRFIKRGISYRYYYTRFQRFRQAFLCDSTIPNNIPASLRGRKRRQSKQKAPRGLASFVSSAVKTNAHRTRKGKIATLYEVRTSGHGFKRENRPGDFGERLATVENANRSAFSPRVYQPT